MTEEHAMHENVDLATRGYRTTVRQYSDGSWGIDVPSLPGCVAAGESLEEAVSTLPEAIDLWIATARKLGRPVPAPDGAEVELSGRFVLRMPKSLHAKLAREAAADGVSLNSYVVTALASAVGSNEGRYGQWSRPSSRTASK